MTVRVKSSFSSEVWYSEMIGEQFICFAPPSSPYIHFTAHWFFYPQDIEKVDYPAGQINSPVFSHSEIA